MNKRLALLSVLSAAAFSAAILVTKTAADDSIHGTAYPVVRSWSSPVYSAPIIRRGLDFVSPFTKFVDDPTDRIVEVRLVGSVNPTTTYRLENLDDHVVGPDDYTVTAYNNVSIYEGDRNFLTGRSYHYGQNERTLQAFDGSLDFAGPSGYTLEYGPLDPNHPKQTASGTLHWTVGGWWHLVSGHAGESTVITVRLDQMWLMDYTTEAWVSPHAYRFTIDHGRADLDFHFEAVHASGRIQQENEQ